MCRAAGGSCDLTENCPGTADAACPSDAKVASGTVCRAASGVCDVAEKCDGAASTCPTDLFQPDGTPCPDGLFCNGNETCQSNVCTDGADPCAFASVCNESSDSCDNTTCPATPTSGCLTAQKSLLLIKNKTFNGSDKLIWKFIKGAASSQPDFADPTLTANYALCIYAGTTQVAAMNIPPSSTNWQRDRVDRLQVL